MPSLDFETFKGRVLPILISPRKGNARCVACHARGNAISFLEPLTPGADAYTDEQARRIFDRIQRVVVPGQPEKSPLLMNPLAEEAGGSHWHSGGKHWTSQSHPERGSLRGCGAACDYGISRAVIFLSHLADLDLVILSLFNVTQYEFE